MADAPDSGFGFWRFYGLSSHFNNCVARPVNIDPERPFALPASRSENFEEVPQKVAHAPLNCKGIQTLPAHRISIALINTLGGAA